MSSISGVPRDVEGRIERISGTTLHVEKYVAVVRMHRLYGTAHTRLRAPWTFAPAIAAAS